MRLFGKQQANNAGDAQAVYPGARCGMLIGELWVDAQTGDTHRNLCGAVATAQWTTTESSREGESVTVAIPLCAAHRETWRAAVLRDGTATREAYPVGTFERWNRQANEQAQEIVDAALLTMTTHLHDVEGMPDERIQRVLDAMQQAMAAVQTQAINHTPALAVNGGARVSRGGKAVNDAQVTGKLRLV